MDRLMTVPRRAEIVREVESGVDQRMLAEML